jgi:hypothetical protein
MRRADPTRNALAVRFDGDPNKGALAVRAAMRDFDPGMFVVARALQSWIDQVTEALWNVVSLIVVLGLVAAVLATSGIYGAVSFAVHQQMRDLGIRVALGASRFDIVREVFVSGGRPVVRGLFFGLWLSVAMAANLRQNMKGSPWRPLALWRRRPAAGRRGCTGYGRTGPPRFEIRPPRRAPLRLTSPLRLAA